jgi:hypothetical protein
LPVSIITLSSFLACILSLFDLDIYMFCITIVSSLSLLLSSIRIAEKEVEA